MRIFKVRRYSLFDVAQMEVMEELTEPRDALDSKVRQTRALGQREGAELRRIANQMVDVLVTEPSAAREVDNPELVETDGDRSQSSGIECGGTRSHARPSLWRSHVDQIPWVCTDVFEDVRLIHACDSLKIRDSSSGQSLVVVQLEFAKCPGIEKDADYRVVGKLRNASEVHLQ